MQQPATAPEQRSGLRGRPFPPGTSGNPLGARIVNQRAAELFAVMAGDFGPLSAVDEVLLRQACRLLARSERLKDPDNSIRMSGEARRLLEALRRHAAPKGVVAESFADIAARAQAEADRRRARELAEDEAEPSLATPVQAASPDAILSDTAARESASDSATALAETAEDQNAKVAGS